MPAAAARHRRLRGAGRRTGLLLAAAVALAGAGCGSYTKHDFIAQADAICANALRATRSIALGGTAPQGLTSLAAYLRQAVPAIEAEAAGLAKLRRPSGSASDTALLQQYLQAVNDTARAYRTLAQAAAHHDAQGVANAEALLRGSPVAALAGRYGLRTCGSSGATIR